MFERQLLGLPIAVVTTCSLAFPPVPALAATCSPPGEVVVTDPAGDAPTPQTDILDIAIQEVVSGVNAGRFVVTLHVSMLGSTPSGLWFVGWQDPSGNNRTTLGMSACAGVPSFTYEYATPEGTESGTPDGGSYTASGTIEWIIARDKIGSPTDGQTFEQITGVATPWVPLDPLPGCIPQTGAEGTEPGQYVIGNCRVDAPTVARPVALRLGSPVPNPARGDVSFALEVPAQVTGQPFEFAVFDMAGRRVSTIESGVAAAGRRMLRWDLRNTSGARVRPGAYWARITIGAERRAQVVFVLR